MYKLPEQLKESILKFIASSRCDFTIGEVVSIINAINALEKIETPEEVK